MVRVLACICFVFAGAITGLVLSDKLKQKREGSREIYSMLVQISSLIRYRRLNVYEIVRELNSSKNYKYLRFLSQLPECYNPGEDFHEQWFRSLITDRELSDDERSLLLSFGSVLGTSDVEGQLMYIESSLESVKALEQRRTEEYQQKGKLYRSLGILFGTMVGIMFI